MKSFFPCFNNPFSLLIVSALLSFVWYSSLIIYADGAFDCNCGVNISCSNRLVNTTWSTILFYCRMGEGNNYYKSCCGYSIAKNDKTPYEAIKACTWGYVANGSSCNYICNLSESTKWISHAAGKTLLEGDGTPYCYQGRFTAGFQITDKVIYQCVNTSSAVNSCNNPTDYSGNGFNSCDRTWDYYYYN